MDDKEHLAADAPQRGPRVRRTRRQFLIGSGAAVVAGTALLPSATPTAEAQDVESPAPLVPGGPWKIGYIDGAPPNDASFATANYYPSFVQGLGDLGYREGPAGNITLTRRFANLNLAEPALKAHITYLLDQVGVDVLVVGVTRALPIAKDATATSKTPIVMAISADPYGVGTLPRSNITGLTTHSMQLIPRQVQLLQQVAPYITSLTVLGATNSAGTKEVDAAVAAAHGLGIADVRPRIASNAGEFRKVIQDAGATDALLFISDVIMNWNVGFLKVLSQERAVPALLGNADFVRAGGLLALGPKRLRMYYRAAYFVDQILRLKKVPDTVPVEGPPQEEKGFNLQTALILQSLGKPVVIPPWATAGYPWIVVTT